MKIRLCANDEVYEVETLGALTPKPVVLDELAAGDVGFIVANIKRVADARVGDTVIEARGPRRRSRDLKPSSRWSSPGCFR
jgi:GTP-binding protein LepA